LTLRPDGPVEFPGRLPFGLTHICVRGGRRTPPRGGVRAPPGRRRLRGPRNHGATVEDWRGEPDRSDVPLRAQDLAWAKDRLAVQAAASLWTVWGANVLLVSRGGA